jgi:HSP20 family protein
MAIIPFKNPFLDLEKWFEEDWPEDLFDLKVAKPSLFKTPKMDIYEDKGNVIVESEIPGVNPENIDIEIKDNYLKVEAKKEEKKEEKDKGYYKKEISKGYYKRIVPLPVEVMADKAQAEYTNGVLKITIPKAKVEKEEKGTKIKIVSK